MHQHQPLFDRACRGDADLDLDNDLDIDLDLDLEIDLDLNANEKLGGLKAKLVGLTGDADLDFGVGDLESDRPGDLLLLLLGLLLLLRLLEGLRLYSLTRM